MRWGVVVRLLSRAVELFREHASRGVSRHTDSGRMTVNVDPFPSSETTSIRPAWSFHDYFHGDIAGPRSQLPDVPAARRLTHRVPQLP